MAAEPASRPAVWIEPADGYVVARLAHPPANPLSPVVLDGLAEAAQAVEDLGARALVITSALDGFFAAGADIKHMRTLDADGFAVYGTQMRQLFQRITELEAISIAAIDGLALGGGLELAFACTLRIGSDAARLGLPEVHLGLIPGAGGTQRLPRLIGRSRALEVLLTGRQVPAPEAHAIGMIDRLVPAGTAEQVALEIAVQLARSSAPALAAIRRCVESALTEELEPGIAVEAAEEQALFVDGEASEGFAAFLERRPPVFRTAGGTGIANG
jgi:enoyl-CoA hydratase/carnithine racemase